jgi:hypothetical protein
MTCLICHEDWKPLLNAHEQQHGAYNRQHLFHQECLQEWFRLTKQDKSQLLCPLCVRPFSGPIIAGLKDCRTPGALNFSLWLNAMVGHFTEVRRILEGALGDPEVLSTDILDTVYVYSVTHNRPELLEILDEFCGKRATPCLAYAINRKPPVDIEDAVVAEPSRAEPSSSPCRCATDPCWRGPSNLFLFGWTMTFRTSSRLSS